MNMARAHARSSLVSGVNVLQPAHDGDRLHAGKLAELLGWKPDDVAAFLGVHKSTLSSQKHQDGLARLGAVVVHAYELMNRDLGLVLTWLRAPIPVLDRRTPKDLIVEGHIDRVESLLDEVESGFAT